MYKKGKSFKGATLPLTSIYLFRGSWEIHVQQLEWIPFPAKTVLSKIDNQTTSGKHIHKATENSWE